MVHPPFCAAARRESVAQRLPRPRAAGSLRRTRRRLRSKGTVASKRKRRPLRPWQARRRGPAAGRAAGVWASRNEHKRRAPALSAGIARMQTQRRAITWLSPRPARSAPSAEQDMGKPRRPAPIHACTQMPSLGSTARQNLPRGAGNRSEVHGPGVLLQPAAGSARGSPFDTKASGSELSGFRQTCVLRFPQ